MIELVLVAAGSLVLGRLGAWGGMRWGGRLGFLDYSNQRSSHVDAVPKGGGVGILLSFFISTWGLNFPLWFWLGAGGVSLMSLYGDRHEIDPIIRLGVQMTAGILFLIWGLPGMDSDFIPYPVLVLILAVYIAGTANYYNFMDGINGIAAISGIVGFWMVSGFAIWVKGEFMAGGLAFCMGMSCLGFLPYNIPIARVFMGDVGSILLGFVFAILNVWLSSDLDDFITLCACLFPFYADELTTTYFRLKRVRLLKKKGSPFAMMAILMKPHREHLYQLLANEMGIAHWKVALGYGGVQFLIGITAMIFHQYGIAFILPYLVLLFLGTLILSGIVRNRYAS